MNLQEILNENITDSVPFNRILIGNLKSKYPAGKFVDVGDGVETPNEEYGHGKSGLLVVANPETQNIDNVSYVGIKILVAYTGKYKGALMPSIKDATEKMLRLMPGSEPALFLQTSDESNGAWENMAKSLNYRLLK